MAIYRGQGGAGDASNDATNASALALAASLEAQTSATEAASSAVEAAASALAAAEDAVDAANSAIAAAASASSVDDANLVHKTGDETIGGTKIFSSPIVGTVTGSYTKGETDDLLDEKANSADTYNKAQTDTLLNAKANQSSTYTKAETDTLLTGKLSSADGSVTSSKIADGAVTDAKIATMSASKLTGDVAAARITSALNATGSAPIYACRAWVNFNGTGTVAIRASGNVSSITDRGTGQYGVNLTTAMPDANYAAVASVTSWAAVTYSSSTASVCEVITYNTTNGAAYDDTHIKVAIFR